MKILKQMLLCILILTLTVNINAQGYEEYSGKTAITTSSNAKAPSAPIDPPRLNSVDAEQLPLSQDKHSNEYSGSSTQENNAANLSNLRGPSSSINPSSSPSYRPPPPPTRREAESQGQCEFDKSEWILEPQSAIAQAIMFDRTSGISCNACLKKCSEEFQDHSVPWVCRSVTYDHEWQICDLFAINGTESPFFLTEFDGRDYFSYLAALPPTDKQIEKQSNNSSIKKENSSFSSEEKSINDKHSSACSSSEEKLEKDKHSSVSTKIETNVVNEKEQQEISPSDAENVLAVPESPSSEIIAGNNISTETTATITKLPYVLKKTVAPENNAKSYGAKIEQISQEVGQSKSSEIINENSASAIEVKNNSQLTLLADFQSALENLKQESEISGNTAKTEPKLIKIGKKTIKTTIIQSNNNAPKDFKSLRSSIQILPISNKTDSLQTAFVQESLSESFSSASASSSALASSSSSNSSSQILQSFNERSPSHIEIVSQTTNSDSDVKNNEQKQSTIDTKIMSSCDDETTSRFVSFEGFERSNKSKGKSFIMAQSLDDCVDACESQRLQNCTSIVFSVAHGCALFASPIDHTNADVLVAVPNSFYVEKFCIPNKKAQKIRKISPAVPNHILVGHVQEVTDAKSFLQCQLSCLSAEIEFGFICKSAMWYPLDKDQNCLLNAESRHSQPDVFVTEDPGVSMIYFELVPEKTSSALKIKAIQHMMRFRDLPLQVKRRLLGSKTTKKIEISKWTKWSSCKSDDSSSKIRTRYMKCTDYKDIRKCPKETMACTRNEINECRAVRDALGRKHCPFGMRTNENGQREFCTKPIDCL